MATGVEVGGDITLYGRVIIPAYVEKHAPDFLYFSKPRWIKTDVHIVIVKGVNTVYRHFGPDTLQTQETSAGKGYFAERRMRKVVKGNLQKIRCGFFSTE